MITATHSSRETQQVASKLGQLQNQLVHLPSVDEDDYQRHLTYTRRFAGELLADLEHLLGAIDTPSEGA